MVTLAFGAIGVLASQDMPRLASYSLLMSAGTLLASIGLGDTAVTAAALYYLVVSTLGVSAFFLLIELVERGRKPGADMLAVTAEVFGEGDEGFEPKEEVGIAIPATIAILGLAFTCCALLIAGLPPLPGFVAKFALLSAMLAPDPVPAAAWALLVLLILSGLATLIAMARTGVRIFWGTEDRNVPCVRVIEMAPVILLLALCIALTVRAGPAMHYLESAAQSVHAPEFYVEDVLSNR
jgi:multicomponent K+:H+ antiporter subunit D